MHDLTMPLAQGLPCTTIAINLCDMCKHWDTPQDVLLCLSCRRQADLGCNVRKGQREIGLCQLLNGTHGTCVKCQLDQASIIILQS